MKVEDEVELTDVGLVVIGEVAVRVDFADVDRGLVGAFAGVADTPVVAGVGVPESSTGGSTLIDAAVVSSGEVVLETATDVVARF